MSSRAATKAAVREQRLAVQRAQERSEVRRRLHRLLGIGAAVVLAVTVAIVLASSGGGSEKAPSESAGAVASLYAGIPQQGLALGRPDAPVTLIEYADLQCPACRAYADSVVPTLVTDYVRTGKLRLEIRLQSFLGPDSITAAQTVAAAAQQDRAWPLIDLLYRHQGVENSGYVTDSFLTELGSSVEDLDVERMLRDRTGAPANRIVQNDAAEFERYGFTGTPSFRIGQTGKKLAPLEVSGFDPAEFSAAVDAQLAR